MALTVRSDPSWRPTALVSLAAALFVVFLLLPWGNASCLMAVVTLFAWIAMVAARLRAPSRRGLGRCTHLPDAAHSSRARRGRHRRRHGRRVNPVSGEHDRVAAADGAAIDNRGVNADVHFVVLSSRAEDS